MYKIKCLISLTMSSGENIVHVKKRNKKNLHKPSITSTKDQRRTKHQHLPIQSPSRDGIWRPASGWVNLRRPGGTKVFTEVVIYWKMRKDRVTVTNPLLWLLGIFLIPHPSVHIPATEKRKKEIRFGQIRRDSPAVSDTQWWGFIPAVTLKAPVVLRGFPSLSGCSETHASPSCSEANKDQSAVR